MSKGKKKRHRSGKAKERAAAQEIKRQRSRSMGFLNLCFAAICFAGAVYSWFNHQIVGCIVALIMCAALLVFSSINVRNSKK